MTLSTDIAPIVHAPAPTLRFAFRIDAEVADSIPIDQRAGGELGFIPITGGTVSGDLAGVVTSGGDWCLQRDEETYRVEARYGLRLDGGAFVDVHNIGILNQRPRGARGAGPDVEYFMTSPVVRTVDPGLDWLNHSVFVGHAQELEGLTRIDVFEVLLPVAVPVVAG